MVSDDTAPQRRRHSCRDQLATAPSTSIIPWYDDKSMLTNASWCFLMCKCIMTSLLSPQIHNTCTLLFVWIWQYWEVASEVPHPFLHHHDLTPAKRSDSIFTSPQMLHKKSTWYSQSYSSIPFHRPTVCLYIITADFYVHTFYHNYCTRVRSTTVFSTEYWCTQLENTGSKDTVWYT